MPLARYFFYVGGVLLALLFISDAVSAEAAGCGGNGCRSAGRYGFIPIANGRSALFSTPASRPSRPLKLRRRRPAFRRRRRSPTSRPRRACATRLRSCNRSDQTQAQSSDAKKPEPTAAAQTQDCKATYGPSDDIGGATTAIRFLCQQHMVSRSLARPRNAPAAVRRTAASLILRNVSLAGSSSLIPVIIGKKAYACPQEVYGMRKVPNLSISPEKVFFIVAKARQSDSKATELDLVTDLSDDDTSYGLGGRQQGDRSLRAFRLYSRLERGRADRPRRPDVARPR